MVKRRGVTLMELLLVVGIVSVLFTIAAPLMKQVNRQFIMVRSKMELQQEARGIMYIITRSLRQAQSSSIIVDRVANQPFYSKISFTTSQSSSTFVSNQMAFEQEGKTLFQTIGGRRRPLTRNLYYLAFTFPRSDDMGIMSVSLTLQKGIYEGQTKTLHMASEKVRIMN